jgi:hypothetical protein
MPRESHELPTLVTSREPVAPVTPGGKGSIGDMAFQDACIIIGVAWVLAFGLWFSLRRHNA